MKFKDYKKQLFANRDFRKEYKKFIREERIAKIKRVIKALMRICDDCKN